MASASKPRTPVALPLTGETIANDPLAKAVAGINVSVTAKGMLPPSSCKLANSTQVTCLAPKPAVDVVIFRTYPSLQALRGVRGTGQPDRPGTIPRQLRQLHRNHDQR
jgi:hypothetical protein